MRQKRSLIWLVVGRRLTIKRKLKSGHARLKTKLGLPDLEHAKIAVIVSLRSFESQRSYRHSIDEFVAWYCSAPRLSFNKAVVLRYASRRTAASLTFMVPAARWRSSR